MDGGFELRLMLAMHTARLVTGGLGSA